MKEVEDMIFCLTDARQANHAAGTRPMVRSRDDKNYVAWGKAREAFGVAWRTVAKLVQFAKEAGCSDRALGRLLEDYEGLGERKGSQTVPQNSQELAELRQRHAAALLALREAHARL